MKKLSNVLHKSTCQVQKFQLLFLIAYHAQRNVHSLRKKDNTTQHSNFNVKDFSKTAFMKDFNLIFGRVIICHLFQLQIKCFNGPCYDKDK